jgi:hypothetical protein
VKTEVAAGDRSGPARHLDLAQSTTQDRRDAKAERDRNEQQIHHQPREGRTDMKKATAQLLGQIFAFCIDAQTDRRGR